jgi:hypothetical protein
MNLADILNACQGDQLENWRVIPGGSFNEPGTDLLVGLFNAGTEEEPALTALDHLYRAVYLPDARLGLGWGMRTRYTDERKGQRPDWADSDWGDPVEPCLAHVLLNGTMVWRVTYTYVNRGAGRDGILPWPTKKFEEGPNYPLDVTPGGWNTTRWEVEFARLLSDLQGIDDWDYDDALRGWGLKIFEVSPLELTRPRGPQDD